MAKSDVEYQRKLDEEYKNADSSPLYKADRLAFDGHDFFSIDKKYIVKAHLNTNIKHDTMLIPTASGSIKKYIPYALAQFELDGKKHSLTLYKSVQLMLSEEYKDYIFLPFRDHTNNVTSYGGGRYIDLEEKSKAHIWIDFNKAYNPYCAYSEEYNCPIVPVENTVQTEVRAGVRLDSGHFEYHK